MTRKSVVQGTRQQSVKTRNLVRLQDAYVAAGTYVNTAETFKILRAAVKALFPGTQTNRNTEDAMTKAVAAACRVIRRGKVRA